MIPSWSPSGPMRRTSRARMRSLIRCSARCGAAMAVHPCAMADRSLWSVADFVSARRQARGADLSTPPSRAVGPGRTHCRGGRVGVAPTSLRYGPIRVAHVPEDSTPEEVTSADDGETVLGDAEQAIEDARRRLAEVPAEVVVTNHVMGLYELAAIHLSANHRTCPAPPWRSTPSAASSTGSVTGWGPMRRRCGTLWRTCAWPSSASSQRLPARPPRRTARWGRRRLARHGRRPPRPAVAPPGGRPWR